MSSDGTERDDVRYVADPLQMGYCGATLILRCSTEHGFHGAHERIEEVECIECGTFHDFVLERSLHTGTEQ